MSDATVTPWRPATDEPEATENDEKQDTKTADDASALDTDELVYDEQHGEWVNPETGEIVREGEIDRGPEWRAFDSAERDQKSRVGSPTTNLMHDHGLSTNIGWRDRDAYGNSLSTRQRQKMKRLRTWNERYRTRDSKERNLKQALGEIERMGSALGLPDTVRETASVIYRRALSDDLLPGRSIEGVATAAVYAAARQAGVPRSLDEVQQVSRVEKMELTRTYRYVSRELNLDIQPADPTQYLPRFVSDLDATDEVERRARTLLRNSERDGLHSGKSPVGLAAAAIYAGALLADEELTQEAVSDVTDISEVTIRNRYRELLEARHKRQQKRTGSAA
ncbi:transcription initiation factor TFB [Haloferax mucosum ATCC BAA-1512]|uniref:Transcription initiation factor IIB n=1 Tax=Haloferax mucosum ATCC BAA-1512 TaxID=662479 RepID=M0IEM4_9EURY|nr:transcription initiation factor TFB [Haloferax mucosum]ELZ94492.1 transcription initiation factor TFB [Haloferax mucosum ATCC BAA-1512]